ncbi:MAG TPA: RagB/SusD family nutrient uptake outer membrane protein, partial [Niabella sp.]|nr:RagB/SusD family nutrient uptake outer membrane protein [Niabella sp.]
DAAYGKALTMTTMEQLISSWDVTASTTDQKLGLFQYDDAGVETSLANIFLQQYKIIAGINIILANVDSKKAVFSPGNYELIKGECLALRAYVHFDLLRLFGPVPANATNANLLAYVKTVSKIANPHISVDAYKTELLN